MAPQAEASWGSWTVKGMISRLLPVSHCGGHLGKRWKRTGDGLESRTAQTWATAGGLAAVAASMEAQSASSRQGLGLDCGLTGGPRQGWGR